MYCVLRLRACGNITWIHVDDKKTAQMYYWIACMFNVYNDSFIALFERSVMLRNNQEEKF